MPEKPDRLDAESKAMYDELRKGRYTVNITPQLKAFVKKARKLEDYFSKPGADLCKADEKDECCLLALQAHMVGIRVITYTFKAPNGFSMFAVDLKYCPACGKEL